MTVTDLIVAIAVVAAVTLMGLATLAVLALGLMIAGLERADDQGGWDE